MFWLERQLKEESNRKFIILQHVYGGARYDNHAMWNTYPNLVYFKLIEKHRDRIILEVGGHDHFTSMRYHTQLDIFDTEVPAKPSASLFHNILINPSMTPWYSNNPGISRFEVHPDTLVPFNYQASFLNLEDTIGKPQRTPYAKLSWRHLDYKEEFGLEDLTVESIHALRVRLQKDPAQQQDFMIMKMGLDPSNKQERDKAIKILESKGLVDEKTGSFWPQICLMAKSLSTSEFAACTVKDPTRPKPQKKALSDSQQEALTEYLKNDFIQ